MWIEAIISILVYSVAFNICDAIWGYEFAVKVFLVVLVAYASMKSRLSISVSFAKKDRYR